MNSRYSFRFSIVLWTFDTSNVWNVSQNTVLLFSNAVCFMDIWNHRELECLPRQAKNFKYINFSKTHWECQCVMETIMYFDYIVQKTHWHSQCVLETFEEWYLEMSLKTHWEILLINVWSVWSVLWRTSRMNLIFHFWNEKV